MLTGWICPACGEANTPFSARCVNGSHAGETTGETTNTLRIDDIVKTAREMGSQLPPTDMGTRNTLTEKELRDAFVDARDNAIPFPYVKAPDSSGPPSERKLVRNAARCVHCDNVIESTHRHDFVTCACGRVSVDGGLDYIKRSFQVFSDFEDLAEWE